jgi:hypothetical protein
VVVVSIVVVGATVVALDVDAAAWVVAVDVSVVAWSASSFGSSATAAMIMSTTKPAAP